MAEKDLKTIRIQKTASGIDEEIAKVEQVQLGKAAAESSESVEFEGDRYYKLPSGGWRGPGGNYGPTTELGRKLGDALQSKTSQANTERPNEK